VSGIMPLGHGLMIGEYALSDNAMKLVPKTDFTTKDTDMNYSYYVQLSYFANHKDQTVKDLSEESVKTQTFMVGVGTESNPYLIRNESDWIAFAQSVKSGRTYENKFIKVSDEIHELNFDSQTSIYTFITVGTIDQPFEG